MQGNKNGKNRIGREVEKHNKSEEGKQQGPDCTADEDGSRYIGHVTASFCVSDFKIKA